MKVRVCKEVFELKIREVCGMRFVPDPGTPFAMRFTLYRIHSDSWPGVHITCTEAEESAWRAAYDTYLAALYQAEAEAIAVHGVRFERTGAGACSWRHPVAPLPLPGWRVRMAKRSYRAQRACRLAIAAATEAYRPVREVIARRVAAAEAEERGRWERATRKAGRAAEEAAKQVWLYRVHGTSKGRSVHVFRADVAPDPAQGDPAGDPLDAAGLEQALLELCAQRRISRVSWDEPAVRATVTALEGADFDAWWRERCQRDWRTPKRIPAPTRAWPPPPRPAPSPSPSSPERSAHGSTHHTSHGADAGGHHGGHFGGFGGSY